MRQNPQRNGGFVGSDAQERLESSERGTWRLAGGPGGERGTKLPNKRRLGQPDLTTGNHRAHPHQERAGAFRRPARECIGWGEFYTSQLQSGADDLPSPSPKGGESCAANKLKLEHRPGTSSCSGINKVMRQTAFLLAPSHCEQLVNKS